MLAKRIPTIIPDLTWEEALEVTKIHSVMGTLPSKDGVIGVRPFRSPHHTISDIALVGGGSIPKPGKFCALDKEESELLKLAMTELNFSARAYDKILKVSRTIADLAESQDIKTEHLSEAIQYRSLDRQ